ncbi:Chromatin assembly factor 1 subunit [Savitreella phatthalungensis]
MKASAIQVHWHSEDCPIYSAHIEPHGKGRLATAGGDNCVRLWQLSHPSPGEIPTVTYLATLSRHTQAVNVVRFSPKGEHLASAGDDGNVLIWVPAEASSREGNVAAAADDQLGIEREHWRVKYMCRSTSGAEIYDLAWSPDGNYLITGSMDNIARIYDARDGQCVRQIAEHNHYVQGVAWDPLNDFVATQSSDRSLNVYHLKTKDGQLMVSNAQSSSRHILPNHVASTASSAALKGRSASPMRDSSAVLGKNLLPPSAQSVPQPQAIAPTSAPPENAIASPSPSAPGTPVHMPLPMRPPAITPSRRSSFETSASNRGRSLSPAPGAPLPAVKPLVAGSPSASGGQIKLRPFNLYHDEALPSFFRRLTFTPDGSLLLAPAGQYKQVGEHVTKEEEMLNTIYIYSRAGFARPPVAHLPNQRKAAIAIRCSPVLFQLRQGTTSPRPTLTASIDTSSIEALGDLPPSQAEVPGLRNSSDSNANTSDAASAAAATGAPDLIVKASSDNDDTSAAAPSGTTTGSNPTPTDAAFKLPYRMIYAVATQDAVSIYDTQQLTPIAVLSNLHYATFTDLAWSHDGHTLIMTSTDGYCSACVFAPGELGEVHTGHVPGVIRHGHSHGSRGRGSGSGPSLFDSESFIVPAVRTASPARSDSIASNASLSGSVFGQPAAAPVPTRHSSTAHAAATPPLQTPPATPAATTAVSAVSSSSGIKRTLAGPAGTDEPPAAGQGKKRRIQPTLVTQPSQPTTNSTAETRAEGSSGQK